MRKNNIEMLHDTLDILDRGYYAAGGRKVFLKLSRQEMEQIRVFLPEDIEELRKKAVLPGDAVESGKSGKEREDGNSRFMQPKTEQKQMAVSCVNIDSFALARQRLAEDAGQGIKRNGNILVLNLANPVNPGGGVRRGARAQEEDLCRKSSLLLSLESRAARRYYDYNRALETYMGSDAVMITPEVEIIKDTDGNLLKESVVVSVMTCAAPMLRYGLNGMSLQEYEDMLRKRIDGMLRVAAHMGYQDMVLGAFGCGAFRNDARIVSDLFYEAIQSFSYNTYNNRKNAEDFFRRIDFAVLDFSHDQYNFREFGRNFNNYYIQ